MRPVSSSSPYCEGRGSIYNNSRFSLFPRLPRGVDSAREPCKTGYAMSIKPW
ncbi:MAG: glutamate-cysteine ligase family protein [Gemmataceae bacterium]